MSSGFLLPDALAQGIAIVALSQWFGVLMAKLTGPAILRWLDARRDKP